MNALQVAFAVVGLLGLHSPTAAGIHPTFSVQRSKGQPAKLKLVRAGKPVDLTVTAAERKVEVAEAVDVNQWTAMSGLYTLNRGQLRVDGADSVRLAPAAAPAAPDTAQERRIDELQKEVAALRATVDGLAEGTRAGNAKKKG